MDVLAFMIPSRAMRVASVALPLLVKTNPGMGFKVDKSTFRKVSINMAFVSYVGTLRVNIVDNW